MSDPSKSTAIPILGGAPPKPVKVAIVGGGFSGLALQVGLQKYPHIDSHVYESTAKFSELGAGAVLSPNSQRAMQLIDPRIFEGFQRRAAFGVDPPDENGLFPWITMTKGQAPDISEPVMQWKHETKGSTIHRAHFLDELAKLIEPNRAHFGKSVARITEKGDDEPVVLHFKDGTTAEADLVIGTDGIHSVVRPHILGPEHPAAKAFFTGAIIYRVVIPIERAKAKLGDFDAAEQKFVIRCGKDAMVYGFPVANGTLYYIGVTTFKNGPVQPDQWMVKPDLSGLQERFTDWDDYVRNQVELVPDDGTTLGWSIWEMPPAPTYYRGRVAIMGDAAHASTPYQGAGAGQTIEDSLVMERLLGKYFDPAREKVHPLNTIETTHLIFQAFDTVRRPRSQKVQTTSSETGRILTGAEPGVSMKAADMSERMDGRQDWMWNYDQEMQVKDAMLIFEEVEWSRARIAANSICLN